MKLESEKKYTEIIHLCDHTIESNPRWYTTYLYKAISLLNLNDKGQGLKLLDYVTIIPLMILNISCESRMFMQNLVIKRRLRNWQKQFLRERINY